MIFKEFCPHQMKTKIKDNPEYESILNDTLKLMNTIIQSMHEPIQTTYTYLSLTQSLARMMNTKKQKKEGLGQYTEGFKEQKSIIKISIGEKVLVSFVETKKEFKKLNEVNDAEERIKTEKNEFEIWLPMVFMRDPDKIKYG